ncbi:MAG: response regulator [Phycisphaeraceae bacterium]
MLRDKLVLIIDPQPETRLILSHLATLAGAEQVLTARRGDAGLALARAHRPAVVLLDIALPGRDGYSVCQRLRELDGPAPAIWFVTARGCAIDRAQAMAVGADGVLDKPIDPDAVLTCLAAALRPVAPGHLRADPVDGTWNLFDADAPNPTCGSSRPAAAVC